VSVAPADPPPDHYSYTFYADPAHAGQFQGFSGADLFKKAVNSVKGICARQGIPLK
jgi:hypothetical protein